MLICDWDHEPHMMGDDGDIRRTVIGRGPDLKNPQRHQSSVIVVSLLGFGPVSSLWYLHRFKWISGFDQIIEGFLFTGNVRTYHNRTFKISLSYFSVAVSAFIQSKGLFLSGLQSVLIQLQTQEDLGCVIWFMPAKELFKKKPRQTSGMRLFFM